MTIQFQDHQPPLLSSKGGQTGCSSCEDDDAVVDAGPGEVVRTCDDDNDDNGDGDGDGDGGNGAAGPSSPEEKKNNGQQTSSSSSSSSSWIRDDCLEFYRDCLLPSKAIKVKERLGLLRISISRAMALKQQRFPNSQFLEFGVHEGKDMIRMATFLRSIEEKNTKTQHKQKNNNSNNNNNNETSYTTFHGFDSFEGLPEDWINGQVGVDDKPFHKRGAFDTGGQSPDIDNLVNHRLKLRNHGGNNTNRITTTNTTETQTETDIDSTSPSSLVAVTTTTNMTTMRTLDNVQFHKGWFHETLPPFLNDLNAEDQPIAFVHADADLYTSTLTFLKMMCERKLFRKGSIIVFDEFWNYPNWENGEYKAWNEIVDQFGLDSKYEYFGYHAPHPTKKHKFYGYQSVAVVITSDME